MLLYKDTVGIEDGVSVSAKLAWATDTYPIFIVASQLAQSITADKSAEALPEVRVPLSATRHKKNEQLSLLVLKTCATLWQIIELL